uniref:Amine oxidase domain-containing protein n=1 Tax=Sinocyclocheilus rhinocerous TaxID=307959 RepID=A0A673MGL3_9TELE
MNEYLHCKNGFLVFFSCSGPEDAKVVIVGSGFAGLAAAATLVKAGFENVLVLEAMERIGGRVHTTKPFTENIIEVGANWIHGQKGNPLFKMAKEENLLSEGTSAFKKSRSVTPQDYFFKEYGKQVSTKCSHYFDQPLYIYNNVNTHCPIILGVHMV